MNSIFADRMLSVHKSFIREILKVTEDPNIISFAGGLPNPRFFPVREVAEAAQKVLSECGAAALQYSTTEGHPPLRDYIAHRYAEKGLTVSPEEILITTGSQQGLDLAGKDHRGNRKARKSDQVYDVSHWAANRSSRRFSEKVTA